MSGPFTTVMRRLALDQVRYVKPVRPAVAVDLTARVYQQVERDFGVLAPPVALHSPAPEVMAASWLLLRETMIAPGLVDRATKEAVASAVSLTNTCPYCVTVHSATLHALVHGGAAAAISADKIESVQDPVVREAAAWARDGAVRETAAGHGAPFPVEQAPEYVGVALTFQYLNRMVNVFLEDAPMPAYTPRQGLPMVKRVLSTMIRAAGRTAGDPGGSLDLLPASRPAPADLAWSAGNPAVAEACIRAAAAVEQAARRSVPASVRKLVLAELADWDGQSKGLSRAWVEVAVDDLPPADRPAGRLALLIALASYQVDKSVIDEFRLDRPDDAALIELAAWSALTAARRVAAWMPITAVPGARPLLADDLSTS
jgi:AhpD family alkylhydroperoxidase